MKVIREYKKIPNLSLALGFFDGVHLGHQAVIKSAVDAAKELGTESAIITFTKRPRDFFSGETSKVIYPLIGKYHIIASLGVDYLIELDFEQLHNMSPTEYLEDVLVKYFSPKVISTGFNHHFGVNKAGNVYFLSDHQDKYGYQYFATPPYSLYGGAISSSVIRNFLFQGDINEANLMLGRKFAIRGVVEEGQKLGQTIGFPTANIPYPEEIVRLKYGVYETNVQTPDGVTYKAITNIGVRPTVSDSDECVIETHILNLDGNLYGQTLRIEFVKMIREEIKFIDLETLKMQIAIDIQSIQ